MTISSLLHKTTLVVFALEAEARTAFSEFQTLFCGVGKVNASHKLMRRLAAWRHAKGSYPSLVLNVGSAGSGFFSRGDVVNCTRFIQRDFDATALGAAPYETPFESGPGPILSGLRRAAFPEGVCGTGDSFVTATKKEPWNVIDMEAFALAKVCHEESVSFGCLKYITDGANASAPTDWVSTLDNAAKALREATNVFLAEP